ncbi:PAS domain S-box protein [Gigaspora margarita]|uniref:PAS domain S-box protein n=1 Tax=Gigaspora margarita TaxID=4874 RepID=A0A8H4A5T3_GIGMA|nr:PAS domain S-box protein [Gigaspora margarita]
MQTIHPLVLTPHLSPIFTIFYALINISEFFLLYMPLQRWFFVKDIANSNCFYRSILHYVTGIFLVSNQMSDQTNRHSLSIRSTSSEGAEEKNLATLTTFAATEIPEKTNTISDEIPEKTNTISDDAADLCFKGSNDVGGKGLQFEDRFVVNFYNTTNNSNTELRDNPEIANTDMPKNTRNVYYRNNSNTTTNTSSVKECFMNRIRPSPQTLSTIIIPIVIFLLGIIMGIAVFFVILGQERRRYRIEFGYYCGERKNAIVSGFWRSLATARDFCAFLSVTPNVTGVLINRYGNFSSMLNMNIRSVNFAPLVKANDRLSWEKENGIIMKQLNSDGEVVTRDYNGTEYFPLQYINPWRSDSIKAIGFDVYSQTDRRRSIDALRRAKNENVTITSSVQLVFNTSVNGVLVLFPFYKNLTDPHFIPPDKDIDGLVIGVYDINRSFGKIIEQFQDVGLSIKIIDSAYDSLIFDSSRSDVNYRNGSDGFMVEIDHKFADRNWTFQCVPSESSYNYAVSKTMPSVSLVLFTLFFGLLGFLTSRYFRKYLSARDKVSMQTRKLGETQSLLKAITADSKAVLEAIADPLIALNAKGEIVGANQHALHLTGYSPNDIKVQNRMHVNQLLIPIVETPAEEREISDFDPMQVPVRPGMRDVMARKKDGTCFEAEANFSQQVVEKNYFTQVVMFRDVSFKKENERAVIEAKKEAEMANQSKTEFLFFLCHEIRNPIHAIFGFAEMLKNSFKEKEQEELDYIMSAGKFLSFIVNDILDLTHLTNPNPYEIELKCEPFELHALISNLAKIQSVAAINKKINIKTILHSDIPRNIYGDARRIEQVINKLIARSIEIAPEGGVIELEIQALLFHSTRGVLLRFSVLDESEGLSSDKEIAELFKPYSKANSSIGSRFHAQGLSMALAQAIVKVMGGKLHVDKAQKKQPRNRVWFDIWLRTDDKITRDTFKRGSFDVAISPTHSTDETYMEYSPETTDFKAQLHASKSISIAKSLPSVRPYKSTLRRKRRQRLSNGEESDDGNNNSIIKGNFFQRNGSVKVTATGFGGAGSSHQNNTIVNDKESVNDSIDSIKSFKPSPTFPPIITLYPGVKSQNDSENLNEDTTFTQKSISSYDNSLLQASPIKLKSDASIITPPRSPTLLNTQDATSDQPSVATDEHSNQNLYINIQKSPVQTIISSNNTSLTPPSSSHAAHPPLSTTSSDQTLITLTTLQTENSMIDDSNANVTSSIAPLSLSTSQTCQVEQSLPQTLKVLLVEDNLICQRVTSKMLVRNNYSVDIANNGKEAIDMVEERINMGGYSCILMDIITPVMNGYEATKLLRERGVDIPILALTANSFNSDFKKAIDVGMDAFLTKPIKEVVS